MLRAPFAILFLSSFLGLHALGTPNFGSVKATGLPVAKIKGSKICCPSDTITLDGWASIDVGGEVTEWQWDLDGDNKVDTVTTTGELTIEAPQKSKSYCVILRVKDNENNISSPDTATMHVMEHRPKVTVGPDTTVQVGVRVFFEPGVVCHCGKLVHFEWDLDGDGKFEYHSKKNGNTSKAYFRPGKYRTRFNARNSLGSEAGSVRTIVVTRQLPR